MFALLADLTIESLLRMRRDFVVSLIRFEQRLFWWVKLPWLAFKITVAALSCGIAGQTPPWLKKDMQDLWAIFESRRQFMNTAEVQTMVAAELISFTLMCLSHPSVIDGLCLAIAWLSIFLTYIILAVGTMCAERALEDKPSQDGAMFWLSSCARSIFRTRFIGVPTPPPLRSFRVA
jgi:hypothetical protein